MVQEGSKLKVHKGSTFKVSKGSSIKVRKGSTFQVQKLSTLKESLHKKIPQWRKLYAFMNLFSIEKIARLLTV